MKEDTLVVHEIYRSVQGESTFAGLPCTFVRLTGCNLRCTWCDTPQAFYGGKRMRRADVLARALALGTPLVELTGGEPLLQPGALAAHDASSATRAAPCSSRRAARPTSRRVDPRVHKIMDLKAPGSGECHRNRWENLEHLTASDEIKFVLAGRADYEWMRSTIRERDARRRAAPTLLASTRLGQASHRGSSSRGCSRTRSPCGCRSRCTRSCGAPTPWVCSRTRALRSSVGSPKSSSKERPEGSRHGLSPAIWAARKTGSLAVEGFAPRNTGL